MVCRMMTSANFIPLDLNANTADYNVFVAAGNPATAVDVVLTIAAGVVVYQSVGVAALRTGALPAGSTLKIVNHGYIVGGGGAGAGGGSNANGNTGGTGGPAIYRDVNCPITIDNTDGYVFGGGGGGGGGGADAFGVAGGGGGGAGIGYNNASGGTHGTGSAANGSDGGGGSGTAPGGGGDGGVSGDQQGGTGGAGGSWGDPGDNGAQGVGIFPGKTGGPGGPGGNAVKLNGGTAPTWTPASAQNFAQVKGPIG